MGILRRIWVSMRTGNQTDAGTDSSIALIITEGGVVKLRHIFPDTSQDDLEKGKANLYEINVAGMNIRSENLTDSSFRLFIQGSDFWHPEHVLIWGQESADRPVTPLAMEVNIRRGLSTDQSEGNVSLGLRRISVLRPSRVLRQLLLVVLSADVEDAGTSSDTEIELNFAGGQRKWIQQFFGLRRGQASFIFPPGFGFVGEPQPTRFNLDSIVVRIKGDDAWLPKSFFLFAFDHVFSFVNERYSTIRPLVDIPNWNLGKLSTDPNEGRRSVILSIDPLPNE